MTPTALKAARADARKQHAAGSSGVEVARALASSMDDILIPLFEEHSVPGMALVALGGYARSELCPQSDVDLMVLHDSVREAGERAQRIFYPLWDAGLTVGHAVRTPKECLRLAKDNLEAETSFLNMRLIAGDRSLSADLCDAALKQTRKRGQRFLADLEAMMSARHAAGGSATSQLEPNLKEGAGGLRDLHALGWMETVFPERIQIDAEMRARLADANEMLLRVRNELHYRADRPTDMLTFTDQRPIARFLCYLDGERPAEDAFMRDLFGHTRDVEHVVRGVMADLAEARPVTAPLDLDASPEAVIEIFCSDPPPGAQAVAEVRAALRDRGSLPWTDGVKRAFFRLLRLGDARALEAADHAGVMARLIPEWDHVRCQPQHNVYHRFTVDAHLFECVAAAANMLLPEEADGVVRETAADLDDQETLLIAALLHDAGKGTDEDHAVRGEHLSAVILDRIGITGPRADTVRWLVRNHLLLVEAAMRRDLNDENVIVENAVRIGDAERARLLFLLSVADGRATSESAWTPWKASLVTELFTKALHVLERRDLTAPDAVDLARVRETELRRGLEHHPVSQVDAHIASMSRAYLLAFSPEELIRHFALMSRVSSDGGAVSHALPGAEPGEVTYTVATRDRIGLFATVSGVLALNGVNILTAQGFASSGGIAVEVFRCLSDDRPRFDQVDADLDRALQGRLALEVRLAERRAAYERAPKARRRAPEIIIDNSGDFATVVEVHARDRIGLLYDITRTLADLSVDITFAKIATYGEDVVDVFSIKDLDGQKIVDPHHLEEIRRALRFRLETDPILGGA